MQTSSGKITFRPTDQENRFLRIVAGHLQVTRQTPFVSQAETIKAALRLAAESVAKAAGGT